MDQKQPNNKKNTMQRYTILQSYKYLVKKNGSHKIQDWPVLQNLNLYQNLKNIWTFKY